MKWVVVAALVCAVLGVGVAKRDWLIRRFQHAPGTRLVMAFDAPVPAEALDRARELIAGQLPLGASVRVDGDSVIAELDPDPLTASVVRDVEALLSRPPRVELRVVDVDSEYMKKLSHRSSSEVTIQAKTDGWKTGDTVYLDVYLVANDDLSRKVNEAWAARHGCTARREEHYGIHCTMTGRDQLEAFVHGDPDLGIDALPPELTIADDHELVFGRTDARVWRSYYVERAPLVLDGRTLAGATATEPKPGHPAIALALTPTGAQQIARFAEHSPSGRLAILVGGEVRGVVDLATIRAGDRITFAYENYSADAETGLRIASLPARLRLTSKSTY